MIYIANNYQTLTMQSIEYISIGLQSKITTTTTTTTTTTATTTTATTTTRIITTTATILRFFYLGATNLQAFEKCLHE